MALAGSFRVGTVIRRTVDILGGDMPRFLALAAMFDLLPQLASFALASAGRPGAGAAAFGAVPGGLLVFLVATVGKGATIAATLAACEGRPWSLRSAIGAGSSAFPSSLGVLILDYLGVGFASILLVVPGLMLLCRWVVALPANVAERPGLRAALARSRDLTDGHRWPVFGLLLLFGLLSAAVPLAALLLGFGRGSDVDAGALVSALSAAVFGMVGSVGAAVLYAELKAAKGEGPARGVLAAFE